MYTHPCIKCGNKYTDEDPDPYYCPSCNKTRKQIAQEIDAKIHPSYSVKGNWASFEEGRTIQGEHGMAFVHEKDI